MDKEPWLTFSLEDTVYALPVKHIREVSPWARPEPVPAAPHMVEGIINSRGEIVTVVEARTMLGLESVEADDDTRIMTLELPGETIGLTVDKVREITQLAKEEIEPPHTPQAAILGTRQVDDILVVALDIGYISDLSAREGK